MSDSHLGAQARVNGWGMYATLGFVACAVVHAGTYVGRTLSPNAAPFFALAAGTIPVFIALFVRSRRWQPQRTFATGVGHRQLDWREWRPFLPVWAPRAVALLGVYCIATFVVAVPNLPRGHVALLTNHQAVYMVRTFSGGWSMFYGLCSLYFTYAPNDSSAASSTRGAAV